MITENMTNPPAFLGKMKYSEITDFSESSQDDMPLKTTSLSRSSLLRAEANLPLHARASLPTMAAATSRPATLGCGGMIRTNPVALSAAQATPDDATDTGVSDRLSSFGCGREAFRMKFDAICIASS